MTARICRRNRLFIHAAGLVILGGCMTIGPRPVAPWGRGAPNVVAPQSTNAPAGSNAIVNKPQQSENGVPTPLAQPDPARSIPLPTNRGATILRAPSNNEAAAEEAGPKIMLQRIKTAPKLELHVDVAERMQVGSQAVFQLSVRNTGDEPAEDVLVESEFDEALTFPGKPARKVAQSLGRLVGGEAKEIMLTLTSDVVGRHCCRFAVVTGGVEAVWKSVCVEFQPQQFELSFLGPAQRTVGSRAEYTIKLVNRSSEDFASIEVVILHDAALSPKEATAGVERSDGQLAWKLAGMKAGEGVQLQVEFECNMIAEHGCLYVEVSGESAPTETAESCLKVTPVPGVLDLQLADVDDLISLGDETEYVATVRNRGLQSVRDVKLWLDLPPQLRVVSFELHEGERLINVDATVTNERLDFAPVPELSSDGALTYRVRVKAVREGDITVRSGVSHSASTGITEVQEPTTINLR